MVTLYTILMHFLSWVWKYYLWVEDVRGNGIFKVLEELDIIYYPWVEDVGVDGILKVLEELDISV